MFGKEYTRKADIDCLINIPSSEGLFQPAVGDSVPDSADCVAFT
jgi:hypothetical protein